MAILPLIGALRHDWPALHLLLTTGTVTSAQLAADRLPADVLHQYLPLDAPRYMGRFLDHWRPQLAVLTESEIWPNLILEASSRGIPLALVNARMSTRSLARWRKRADVARPLFGRLDVVVAQNEKLARRFAELGAPRTLVAGNLKIDAPPPPVDAAALGRLRDAISGRPQFVAASTHDGEDQIVAAAHRAMADRIAGLITVIAPRHPERGGAIASMLKAQGLAVTQRSLGELPERDSDIYVADTIGELGTLYALSPVAFIGGSLVAHGGQNPIEAIRHGAAIVTGPHWQNFQDAYSALLRHRGAVEARDAAGLAQAIGNLLTDSAERERMRTSANDALAGLSGALSRTLAALAPLLGPVPEASRVA
jgi:3-deoxy-D-manno-octulosonic-acid transferase